MTTTISATQQLRDRAASDAARTIQAHWDEELYPVDPFAIARSMGIEVFRGDLPEDISGMIRQNEGRVEMYIDTDENPRRQRFTAAHELGHFVDRARKGNLDEPFVDRRGMHSSLGVNSAEIYANEFAAALLMPAAMVRLLVRRHNFDGWDLARFFDVSPVSADFRVRNLGLLAS